MSFMYELPVFSIAINLASLVAFSLLGVIVVLFVCYACSQPFFKKGQQQYWTEANTVFEEPQIATDNSTIYEVSITPVESSRPSLMEGTRRKQRESSTGSQQKRKRHVDRKSMYSTIDRMESYTTLVEMDERDYPHHQQKGDVYAHPHQHPHQRVGASDCPHQHPHQGVDTYVPPYPHQKVDTYAPPYPHQRMNFDNHHHHPRTEHHQEPNFPDNQPPSYSREIAFIHGPPINPFTEPTALSYNCINKY